MHISEFTYFVAQAQARPGVSVKNCQLGLDLYRNFLHSDFAAGVAFTLQVEDETGRHNVWVYFTQFAGREVFGFKCGDGFMERYMEGQEHFRVDICKGAAAHLPNRQEVAGKLNRLIGAVPKSAPCNFWLDWRKSKTTCPHVDTALAHLREQSPGFILQLKQAYYDAYPTMALAA